MEKNMRGLFEQIFGGKKKKVSKQVDGFFKTLTAYAPTFSSWDGRLYESELVRASVDAIARHAGKLVVDFEGPAQTKLKNAMRMRPNAWMTWSQFLQRTATILYMQTNVWIVPVIDNNLETVGFFPVLPANVDIMDVNGEPWVRYRFRNGETGYMEMRRCGHMVRMQYEDDLFGSGNGALENTMNLMNMQNQGIAEGIKNAATFRFMARANSFADPEDLAREMKRFNRNNLQGEAGGGLLLFPTEYTEIKQLDNKPFSMDAAQMEIIQKNVFDYFGVNQDILQNSAVGDKWAAFYDGCLEPFAIQLAEVLSGMLYTQRESKQNRVIVTANRLQYASTKEKLEVSAQMADRGIMNRNEIREIWGLPPIEGAAGEKYLVRGEYKDADKDDQPAEDVGEGGETNAEE